MSNDISLIQSKTVGVGGIASISFTDIPQSYTDLKLVMSARTDRSGNIADGYLIKPNNTTPTIRYLTGDGTTAYSGTNYSGIFPASTATASTFGNSVAYFTNYANTSYNKSFSVDDVSENNATGAYATLSENLYSSTSAITTIVVQSINSANIVEGSTFYLYGISNVTSTTKATGGIVSSDGTYNYHMFSYSGTFTPTQAISADVLVIAGGGGGGTYGGGGGAGGYRTSSLSLTSQNYTVTVGGGGAGTTGVNQYGSDGTSSTISTITSTGGGGGASYSTTTRPAGRAGGSGGGAGGSDVSGNSTGGAASPSGQGNAGGNSNGNPGGGSGGGGGGGAGAAGTSTSGNAGVAGGNGLNTESSWATATQTGVNGYYAGGGGGGNNGTGAGGLGGGGAGDVAGTANTGGGGGGSNSSANAKAGGSGLVIIRYAI